MGAPVPASFTDCLARAARCRFLFTLLRPPAPGRRAELLALAAEIGEPRPAADVLAAEDAVVAEEAFRLLGPAGPVSLCASDYVQDGYADPGPLMADASGFYRAFGYRPETGENPDHFATIFGFLGFLALKRAFARWEQDEEQAGIAADAEGKFRAAFLHPYFRRFVERLGAQAPEGSAHACVAAYLASLPECGQEDTVSAGQGR